MRSAILVAVILVASLPARADNATAKVAFDKATMQYNLQQFDDALSLFTRAYQESQRGEILFNIAQCQRQLERYEAAARSYRAYLGQVPDAPNREQVQHLIEKMEEAAKQQRAVREAPPTELSRPPAVVAEAPTPPPERANNRAALERRAGLGVGIGGVALCGLGAAFAGLADQAGNTAYGKVYDYNADQRFHSYRDAEIAMFVVGGVAVASGVTLFVLGKKVDR